jgi:CRP-like cAMP-binding protein
MALDEKYKAVARHPLFDGLEDHDLRCLAKAARLRSFQRNCLVFDPKYRNTRHFYIVLAGQLQLRLQNLEEKTMEPGEVFGEVAFFSNDHRTGSVRAKKKSKLLAFPRSVFTEPGELSAQARVKVLQRLAKQIIGYLSYHLQRSSAMLVQQSEGVNLEFKASYDGKKQQKETVVRTIAAMMNAEGGSMLFGVGNSGEVSGLKDYGTEKMDEAVRALMEFLEIKLGREYCDLIDMYGDDIRGKTVLRIDCMPSKVPVFVPSRPNKPKSKNGKPTKSDYVFYRRTGSSNKKLTNREMVPYLKRRFFQPSA